AGNGKMKLVDRWNYHNELGAQVPLQALRVMYAASGKQPAACLLCDQRPVIEHGLYWMTPSTLDEGRYLTAILNSETARARGERYQARGQFDVRHFDKVPFNQPIPRFDGGNELHVALAEAAGRAEKIAAKVELPKGVKFQRARGLVRAALAEARISQRIDDLVAELLDAV
ncbi:MAG TPA: hypothetical protein VGB88_13570, partial [Alphaproteobacteria bacterium]